MMCIRKLPFALALLLATAFAHGQGGASVVIVAAVEEAEMTPTMPIAGTVFSRNDMQITAGVDGRLEFVAEPGTVVAQGDVLARIDVQPLALQRAEQEAQAERASTQLKFLTAQVERQRELTSVSGTARDQTVSDRDVAASDLKIAQVRMRQIDEQLARATMRAPFDGVVAARERRGGEDVGRGTLLGRLIDLRSLEVRVMVPLQFSGRVRIGDELTLYGFESEALGKVRSIVPAIDPRAQTFELRVDPVGDAVESMNIGQLVSVGVPMRSASASLVVPRDALILRREGAFVFLVDAENKATRVAVETGDSRGDQVAVSGELQLGDQVVIRGAETLRDGAQVSIIEQTGSGGSTVSHSN